MSERSNRQQLVMSNDLDFDSINITMIVLTCNKPYALFNAEWSYSTVLRK